ncbi:MAG: DUF3987 domain-containing protein [Bacteroidaceae bacterium]|nr:DUF3987 domain-containing protein [Bacteroidaceae bacterium]
MVKFAFLNNVKDTQTHDRTFAEIMDACRTKEVRHLTRLIAEAVSTGNDERATSLKYQLPCVVWNRSYGDGGRVKKNTGTPTGVVMTDWDSCEDEEQLRSLCSQLQELVLTDPFVSTHLLAAHISPRRHGVHALWQWVDGCHSVGEVQERIEAALACHGLPPMDPSCKDNSRKSFLVDRDYFFYMNDRIDDTTPYSSMQQLQEHATTQTHRKNHQSAAPARSKADARTGADQPAAQTDQTGDEGTPLTFPLQYDAIPYSSIIDALVKRICRKSQLDAFGHPSQGNRHLTWLKVCSQLRTICDNNADWLFQLAPQWAFDSPGNDVMQTCHDACEERVPFGIPKVLTAVIESLRDEAVEEAGEGDANHAMTWLDDFHCRHRMPAMPEFLVPLMQGVPKGYEDAMLLHLLSMFGSMCFSKVRARYLDGKLHAPNLQVVIEGNWGQGKGKFEDVYKALFARIIEADKQKLFEEAAWDEKAERTGANKDLEAKPHQIVLTAGIGITKSKLADVLSDNQGVHFFMFESEILAVVNALKKSYGLTYEHLRKAFENGDVYQNTKSRTSKTGIFPVYFNYTFTGTPADTVKFIGKELEGGTASRICWSVIPENQRYMTRLVLPSYADLETMREQIDEWCRKYVYSRRENAEGVDEDVPADTLQVDLDYINQELATWIDRQWLLFEVEGNAARRDARGRMGAIAFHCAMVLHMLFGCPKPTDRKVRRQVCELSIYLANYCMERFLHKFSESQNEQRKLNRKAEVKQKSGNVLDYLKKRFTRDDMQIAIQAAGKKTPVKNVIYQLSKHKLIEKVKGSDFYTKLV